MYAQDGHKIIYKIRGGSHLYGVNTPLSDEDYIGIFLNKSDEILGLKTCDTIEENQVSKHENGKNTSEAVDCKYYSLHHFCKLACNNNPTILEMFFANKDNIIYCDNFGKKIIDNYHLFISKKSEKSYIGYALSQKQKSFVKSSNLKSLVDTLSDLNKKDETYLSKTMLYDVVEEYRWMLSTHIPSYIEIGDLKFNNQKLKDVKKSIENRINKASHRSDGILQHGLDYKFMSHAVRLLYEGIEVLQSGKITFPLKNRKEILDIKNGKLTPLEIIELIEDLEKKYYEVADKCTLPDSVDSTKINNLLVDIYKEALMLDK